MVYYYSQQRFGHLAQLVEHPLDVRKVSGSSPLMSTKTPGFETFFVFENVFGLVLQLDTLV